MARVHGGGETPGSGGCARLGKEFGTTLGVGQTVEDPPVGGGAARHGLDVAELRVAEPEADRAGRAESVGGLQDDQTATGADERGSGAQELAQ